MPQDPPATTTPGIYASARAEVREALRRCIEKQLEAVNLARVPVLIGDRAPEEDLLGIGVFVMTPEDSDPSYPMGKREANLTFPVLCVLTDWKDETAADELDQIVGAVVDAVGANPRLALTGNRVVGSARVVGTENARDAQQGVDVFQVTIRVQVRILHELKHST